MKAVATVRFALVNPTAAMMAPPHRPYMARLSRPRINPATDNPVPALHLSAPP